MSTILAPAHGVTLGGLALMANGTSVTSSDGYTVEISSDGTTWGNPDIAVTSLLTEMSAGDPVEETHVGNRQTVLYVRFEADTHAGLVAGDTALSKVIGKAVPLVWQPPDPAAPPTVIDVVHSRMEHAWDDLEAVERVRVWTVTMAALPWVRAATKTVTPAVATGSATVVNSGSATTGWSTSRPAGATLSVVSGAVTSSYNAATADAFGNYGTRMTLTGTIDTTTEKFIGVDWKSSQPGYTFFLLPGNARLYPVVRTEPLAGGFTRSWYKIDKTVNSIPGISFDISHPAGTGTQTLSIDQVVKSSTLPGSSSGRQLNRFVDPGGNAPANGDVLIQATTAAGLGQTIIYTYPATGDGGYAPSLRQWLTSSATPVTADATTVSGSRHPLVTTASWYDVPVTALPKGEAHLYARVRLATGSAATVGMFYGIRSVMNGVELDNEEIEVTFDLPAAGTWMIVPIARVVLPPRYLGVNGRVRIYLLRSTIHDIEIDEAWLFGMEKGRLTIVDCGTGTPAAGSVASRLRVSAPSLDNPFGRIEMATAADFSDAVTPASTKIQCDQTGHQFDPAAGANITTVHSGAVNPDVSFEHFARFRAEVA